MSRRINTLSKIRSFPAWIREAFLEWILGLVVAVCTAATLVAVTCWGTKSIEDFGIDIGILISSWWQERQIVIEKNQEKEPYSYVFLDLDPEYTLPPTSSEPKDLAIEACKSLAATPINELYNAAGYQIVPHNFQDDAHLDRGRMVRGDERHTDHRQPLHCSSSRPLNRYLIAELIHALVKREAKLVVVDVVLDRDPATIARSLEDPGWHMEAEQGYLARVIDLYRKASPTRVVYALQTTEPAHDTVTRIDDPLLKHVESNSSVWLLHGDNAGIVFSEPDTVLRRYARSYYVDNKSLVPTLPCLVAAKLSERETDNFCKDHPVTRIQYTVPSLVIKNNRETQQKTAQYSQIYIRCLVWQVFSTTGRCSRGDNFKDKVVILGTSSRFRGDAHFTPLGEMSGAEVVINAIRSFVLAGKDDHEKTILKKVVQKIWIAFLCSFVWLGYFLLKSRYVEHELQNHEVPLLGPARRLVRILVALFTILAVIAVTGALAILLVFYYGGATPNVDVLLPVLAIGLDQYVEAVKRLLTWAEDRLRTFLGLPDGLSKKGM